MKVSFGRRGGPLKAARGLGAPLALCEAPWERSGAGERARPKCCRVLPRLGRWRLQAAWRGGVLFGGGSGQMRRPQVMLGGALPQARSPSGFGAVQRFFWKFRGFWAFRRVGFLPSRRSGRRLFWGPCAHGGSGLRGPWRLPVARRQSLAWKAVPGVSIQGCSILHAFLPQIPIRRWVLPPLFYKLNCHGNVIKPNRMYFLTVRNSLTGVHTFRAPEGFKCLPIKTKNVVTL